MAWKFADSITSAFLPLTDGEPEDSLMLGKSNSSDSLLLSARLSRIAEHIVLAGRTREHRGKSAPVFIAKVGVSPRSAKKHGNIPCS
jgi:hypothetical protein